MSKILRHTLKTDWQRASYKVTPTMYAALLRRQVDGFLRLPVFSRALPLSGPARIGLIVNAVRNV